MASLTCNICGGDTFIARGVSRQLHCVACRSDARTRLMWLMLKDAQLLRPGGRCLHIAPEQAISGRLEAIFGESYEPVDIAPELFPFAPRIRKFDLLNDAPALPSARFDLILHSHVMEHVRGNVTAVLFHLHRALKTDGMHVCCIPILRNRHYAEDFGPLTPDEAKRRFGQDDHVRLFGASDIQSTLGMIFRLPQTYSLLDRFSPDLLQAHAIPEIAWHGWSAHSALMLSKADLLLTQGQP